MTQVWQPPLPRSRGTMYQLLHGKRLIFSGLTLAAVPAAYAFYIHSATPAQAVLPGGASASSQTDADTNLPPSVGAEPSTAGNSNSSSVKVTINGQDIPVPDSGILDTTIPSENGSTSVHVDAGSSGDGSNSSNSSLNVNLNSSSSSSGNARERSTTNLRISSSSR